MPSFANRTILVTGGTAGIGRATVTAFAAAGAKVAFTGRRDDLGAALVTELRGRGAQAHFIHADAASEADHARAVAETVRVLGPLYAAFNNAGIEGTVHTPVTAQEHDNFQRVIATNVWGVLAGMKHQIPAIVAGGGGAIVNNASVAGLGAWPGMATYVASKFAVVGLTRTAALENAKTGVRVNAVAPGPIETEMFDRFAAAPDAKAGIAAVVPMGRAGTPAEIARVVLMLCDPANTYLSGQVLAVDGAMKAG